jgi:hypothetical protein
MNRSRQIATALLQNIVSDHELPLAMRASGNPECQWFIGWLDEVYYPAAAASDDAECRAPTPRADQFLPIIKKAVAGAKRDMEATAAAFARLWPHNEERITAPCADCSIDTLGADGSTEGHWYMVHDEIWQKAWPGSNGYDRDFLCIVCLARRLGRELARHDFTSAPVNRRAKVERLLYSQAVRHRQAAK